MFRSLMGAHALGLATTKRRRTTRRSTAASSSSSSPTKTSRRATALANRETAKKMAEYKEWVKKKLAAEKKEVDDFNQRFKWLIDLGLVKAKRYEDFTWYYMYKD